jgi:MSHA pilin protein MshA
MILIVFILVEQGVAMKRKRIICGNEGFTILEVIAVLLILGILIAVALPKYVDLIELSKVKVAQSQIAEIKSELNLAWGKAMLINNSKVDDVVPVLSNAGFMSGVESTVGSAPDNWKIMLTGADTNVIIVVNARGSDTGYSSNGTWNLPAKN